MFAEFGAGWPLMDDGSRLVAELAAAAVPSAKRVWDCCAAPGGKTMILAKRLGSAEIVATDVSPRRLAQTSDRLKRYSYAERVVCGVADATDATGIKGTFDLILCDAPCSGTGTLAENPEIRHRLKPEDLKRQAERQRAIVAATLKRLAPGGRLVYSTCSLEPEECEDVVAAMTGVRRIPVEGLMEELAEQGVLLSGGGSEFGGEEWSFEDTAAGVHPCDGFFAVVLERE